MNTLQKQLGIPSACPARKITLPSFLQEFNKLLTVWIYHRMLLEKWGQSIMSDRLQPPLLGRGDGSTTNQNKLYLIQSLNFVDDMEKSWNVWNDSLCHVPSRLLYEAKSISNVVTKYLIMGVIRSWSWSWSLYVSFHIYKREMTFVLYFLFW
jgi:hypothetical protein